MPPAGAPPGKTPSFERPLSAAAMEQVLEAVMAGRMSAEETAALRKRLKIFMIIGIVGIVIGVAALGMLFVRYLPEIQNILENAGVNTVAPDALPQTPLNTAAGLLPLLRSFIGGR